VGVRYEGNTIFICAHWQSTTRRVLAKSALNYTRQDWRRYWWDNHYYPVRSDNGTEVARATFCNIAFYNFFKPDTSLCSATTPISQAIGCPDVQRTCTGSTGPQSTHHVVTGHNLFGHDIQWLPSDNLEKWWEKNWATEGDGISPLWKTLDGEQQWCGDFKRAQQTMSKKERKGLWSKCAKRLQNATDILAYEHMSKKMAFSTSADRGKAWSAVYASLPVIRVTVMRNPFSWLMSKFSWHGLHNQFHLTCDDVEEATYGSEDPDIYKGIFNFSSLSDVKKNIAVNAGPGWLRRFALSYIYYVCGTDCVVRHYRQMADLEEIAVQAEQNLRNSFAIVGILEKSDEFNRMLDARVDYIDTSLNGRVSGGGHQSSSSGEYLRCKNRFKDPQFQAELLAACPELAIVNHLYQVAVEVNEFQKNELMNCSGNPSLFDAPPELISSKKKHSHHKKNSHHKVSTGNGTSHK